MIRAELKFSLDMSGETGGFNVLCKMALECTICDPRSQNFSGGGPQTPLKEDVFFRVHLTNMCIHHGARHHTLSDFLGEIHFGP